MADPFGFLKYPRKENPYRDIAQRLQDWRELQVPLDKAQRQQQAARCMNCGIPFCHAGSFYGEQKVASGCPNDNLIPEWNDLLYQGLEQAAFERLARTNPLPEMTGRVCPAPCEKACTEALNGAGVTIHDNERYLIDTAFEKGWVKASGQPGEKTGFKVAIIGSGPAGLSAAWRLNQLGHQVTVYERSDRFGGLLMYGIPNMKLDKEVVNRRIELMKELGITFIANTEVDAKLAKELSKSYDRIILATGASVPRDLSVPGRHYQGISFAVDYLTEVTKDVLKHGKEATSKKLAGQQVLVIGGGDTGNDCVAAALRQGASSVKQLEITPPLPQKRSVDNPWPEYPFTASVGYGQAEGKFVMGTEVTQYQVATTGFIGAERGQVIGVETTAVDEKFQPIAGTKQVLKADLVLLAMGFTGAEKVLFEAFGVKEIYQDYTTNQEQILVAGDAKRGPSLVIWAIREGRLAAEKVDASLRALIYQ